jgi:predicted nucleic acid-binding protein
LPEVRALTSWGLINPKEIGPELRRHAKAIEKIRIPQSNIPNISKTILTNLRIIQMFPITSIMELAHG